MSLSDRPLSSSGLKRFRTKLGRNLRPFLVTLGWGTSFAAATLWAIFQGLLLPKSTILPPSIWQTEPFLLALYYAMIFGISFLSGLCIGDLDKTILGFLASYLIGATVIYEVLSFPGLNTLDIGFRETLAKFSVDWTFNALFPFPLFIGLFGGIVGAAMQESVLG